MFELPSLPYDYNALEPYIDEQTMRLHHAKHHATYVQKLNEALAGHEDLLALQVEELLRGINQVPQDLRKKVQNHGGGHANHSLFWTIMTPKKGSKPEGKLTTTIDSAFGDFEAFKKQFAEVAANIFGSGWAWLVIDPSVESGQNLKILSTPNQDSPLMAGKIPIFGLDVWEHAYYLKYQNRRAEYVKAWWNIVNWEEVTRLFEESQ